ncbi:MAG TPA: hypothetical protein PLV05_07470 [Verrucomicrobiota bacterium]|nr:hypothetical protein [Verrucomicrobiota bacterium]HRR64561.1 hypothetical protein [Candidatus Paceibacterota bacterium]NLH85986.1 hypothetical protein [Verrucomicrobiota bacterium]HNR70050.1 hypothetical protein [Verrucomicrobiota bacterium]HNS68740.1 hypothetical protein [Verrucomicrobiota bacterium]
MRKPRIHRLGDLQLRILKELCDRGEATVAEVHAAPAASANWPIRQWLPGCGRRRRTGCRSSAWPGILKYFGPMARSAIVIYRTVWLPPGHSHKETV